MKCPACNGTGEKSSQKQIGRAMKKLRKSAELSLRDLASRLGFSPAYLSDLENGHRNWSATMINSYKVHCRKCN